MARHAADAEVHQHNIIADLGIIIKSAKESLIGIKNDFDKGQTIPQICLARAQEVVNDPKTIRMVTEVVTDLSPVPATYGKSRNSFQFIVDSYAWTAVCLVAASLGGIVGGYVLPPLVALLLSTATTIGLAYVGVPFICYLRVKHRTGPVNDTETKSYLHGLAFLMGLCNGHNLSAIYLNSFTPPAFLLPASIAIIAGSGGEKLKDNRVAYIGASVAPALLAYLFLAYITESLNATYIAFILLYTGIAMLSLQHTFNNIKHGDVSAYLTLIYFLTAIIVAKATLTFAFGTTAEYAAYKQLQSEK